MAAELRKMLDRGIRARNRGNYGGERSDDSRLGPLESQSARLKAKRPFRSVQDKPLQTSYIGDYSQRKTFAETAVQMMKMMIRAATSTACADHVSPLQIPCSSETA
jgi:hypothetical protein